MQFACLALKGIFLVAGWTASASPQACNGPCFDDVALLSTRITHGEAPTLPADKNGFPSDSVTLELPHRPDRDVHQRANVSLHVFGGATLRPGSSVFLGDIQRLEVPGKGCLDFIHIPKAAGSSVEKASFATIGAQAGGSVVGWGKEDGQLECSHPSSDAVGTFCDIYSQGRTVGRTYIWHTPPSWDSKLKQSYSKCTTFCVVRDPVERAVSEWTYFGGCDGTLGEVNEYIRTNLEKAKFDSFHGGGHWLPQEEYVHGHATAVYGKRSPKGEYCQRVLRFENLTAEFNSLMKEFEFDVTLERHNPSNKCPDKAVTERTRTLIEQFYDVDYKTFGYSIADSRNGGASAKLDRAGVCDRMAWRMLPLVVFVHMFISL